MVQAVYTWCKIKISNPILFKTATEILAQDNIHVDEAEAAIILDFLYLVSKFSKQSEDKMTNSTLRGNRTLKIQPKPSFINKINQI